MIEGFQSFKGRSVDPTRPVRAYRNLNRNGANGAPVWSIRQGTEVVGHCSAVTLVRAKFTVSFAGVLRIRKQGAREVIAFADGFIGSADVPMVRATFNPHLHDGFVSKETGEPVGDCSVIRLDSVGCWFA